MLDTSQLVFPFGRLKYLHLGYKHSVASPNTDTHAHTHAHTETYTCAHTHLYMKGNICIWCFLSARKKGAFAHSNCNSHLFKKVCEIDSLH